MFYGVTQGSVHEVQVAKPSKGEDWQIQPQEYNKGRLKGVPNNFTQPVKSSIRKKVLTDRPYNPSPGMMASDTPGKDWKRSPAEYETYRLKGKTNDQRFRLDPFKAPTIMNQVSNFRDHFALQDRLHPFQTTIGSLPEVFAKAQAEKEKAELLKAEFERRRQQVVQGQPIGPAPIIPAPPPGQPPRPPIPNPLREAIFQGRENLRPPVLYEPFPVRDRGRMGENIAAIVHNHTDLPIVHNAVIRPAMPTRPPPQRPGQVVHDIHEQKNDMKMPDNNADAPELPPPVEPPLGIHDLEVTEMMDIVDNIDRVLRFGDDLTLGELNKHYTELMEPLRKRKVYAKTLKMKRANTVKKAKENLTTIKNWYENQISGKQLP